VESDATNIIVFLLVCASIKFILTIFGPNTIVPGGHMVPSMAVGLKFSKVLYIVTFYVGRFSKVLYRDFL
jgi:H+/Cl- antiporter ClcA